MPTAGCDICQLLRNTQEHDYVVAQSRHWRITLAPDQYYVGRCYVTSLRHVPDLPALSPEEWRDLHEVMRHLENSTKRELGATHVTWAALMNHAYQLPDPQPHVHWHVRPRYAERTVIGDVIMTDEQFGHHHQRDELQKLLPYQMEEIVTSLRRSLPPPWWSMFR